MEPPISTDYHHLSSASLTQGSSPPRSSGLPPLAPGRRSDASPARGGDLVVASSYEEEEETDGDDAMDKEMAKRWDEGGPSDCGYSTAVHDTLMSVGSLVYGWVGAPRSSKVQKAQDAIGNWFQELSYATRDILRGENTEDMHQDAAEVVSNMFYGAEEALHGKDAPVESAKEFDSAAVVMA